MASSPDSRPPGVLMIQIDGLARLQFERALRRGRMPFLRRLMHSEGFHVVDHYSGLPSSTPAVQAEIFFKAKSAVPAFSYYDRDAGRECKLFQAQSVEAVRKRLPVVAEPLLQGGSSYSNIYGGGALRTRFCAEVFGPETALRYGHPLTWWRLLTAQLPQTLKVLWLGMLETGLALMDAVRGSVKPRELFKEFFFVPARVAMCIILREVVRHQAMDDLAEGLPIVHLNLIGYDEQAHRRGPSSRFAHWTLRGIDNTIRDLVKAARSSEGRRYEVLIYSDHGQEDTEYYSFATGHDLVAVLRQLTGEAAQAAILPETHPYHERSRRMFAGAPAPEGDDPLVGVRLCAMGPLAQVYWPTRPPRALLAEYARQLVNEYGVPWAFFDAGPEGGGVRAVSKLSGELPLHEAGEALCGPRHRFTAAVLRDLDYLVRTPQAGDLVLSGWRYGAKPLSFAHESGSHAGPGEHETHGFALLPPLVRIEAPFLRPSDLHDLAQRLRRHHAGETAVPRVALRAPGEPPKRVNLGHVPPLEHEPRSHLRVMTYNIHHAQGMDLRVDLPRIARIIRRYAPDVVALQEVDADVGRSGRSLQARDLGELLGYHHAFLPLRPQGGGQYGIALLSRQPLKVRRAGTYPREGRDRLREVRGVLWAEMNYHGQPVHLFNTHWGLSPNERVRQAQTLLNRPWLGEAPLDTPLILLGDFNALPATRAYKVLARHLQDVQQALPHHVALPTLPSVRPVARVDHIWVSGHWQVRAIARPLDRQARLASDHLPLIADLDLA